MRSAWSDLKWRVVANAGRYGPSRPRWVAVMEAIGHGSTVAVQMCVEAGFDPDEEVGRLDDGEE